MRIKQFCERHKVCPEGLAWALENGKTMLQIWKHPELKYEWLIWISTRAGVLDDRTLRLFAVWSARQVQHLMTDPRSIAALDVAERFANGEATQNELSAAGAAAWAAARAAQRDWPMKHAKPNFKEPK